MTSKSLVVRDQTPSNVPTPVYRTRRTVVMTCALAIVCFTLGFSGSATATPKTSRDYYVSLGDSYAAGYQPLASALKGTDTAGFAYQVVGLAKAKGYHFALRNFGCDGATTSSIIHQAGCPLPHPGPDA